MKTPRFWLATVLLLLLTLMDARRASALDAVVGTGDPASCSEAAFDATLADVQADQGGVITFDCGAASHTIELYTPATIYTQVDLRGGDKIRLLAQGSAPLFVKPRLFAVDPGGWLTLRNIVLEGGRSPAGNGWGSQGGAIVVWGSSDPTERTGLELYNSTILNSASSAWGGAIANEGGSVYLENSLLAGNSAQWGGAYNGADGSETFVNTTVVSSTATSGGGGLRFWNSQESRLEASTVRGNSTAGAGGGVENLGGAVTIRNSYVEENQATGEGGGVTNSNNGGQVGALLVEQSRISLNRSDANGGGVAGNGTTILSATVVAGNVAGGLGGGVASAGGQLQLHTATVQENEAIGGGGIYVNGGGAIVERSTIDANRAGEGAGLFLTEIAGADAGNWVTLAASTITGNEATAAGGAMVAGRAYVRLTEVEIAGNSSPREVVYLWKTTSGGSYMTVAQSSVHDNSGGGFFAGEQATLLLGNTTVSQNTGWGVWAGQGSIYTQVKFSTVRGNTAGQLRRTGGRLALESAAVDAGGVAAANCNADGGLQALEGTASWSSDGTCGAPVAVSSSFNLGPLALNGGATPNHLPQPGSALLEAAGDCTGVTHDQRGTPRPAGAACDVGAVEVGAGAPAVVHLPFVVR